MQYHLPDITNEINSKVNKNQYLYVINLSNYNIGKPFTDDTMLLTGISYKGPNSISFWEHFIISHYSFPPTQLISLLMNGTTIICVSYR